MQDLFAKQKDKNSSVIMKSIHQYIIEGLFKVFINFQRFPEPNHTIFNADPTMVLQSIKPKSLHVAEMVEIN